MDLQHLKHGERFTTWIVTVAVLIVVLVVALVVEPGYARVLGVPVSGVATGIALGAAAAICAATFWWIRAAPRRQRKITVQELRQRAGHRVRHAGFGPGGSVPRSRHPAPRPTGATEGPQEGVGRTDPQRFGTLSPVEGRTALDAPQSA